MSKVVERVARAMALRDRGGDYWDLMPDGYSSCGEDGLFKGNYLAMAHAAIEDMIEPTEAMVERVARAICRARICGPKDHLDEQENNNWRSFEIEAKAGIAAVLKDGS